MGTRLKEGVGNVYVLAENGVDMVPFAEGVDIPDWAADQMGDHCFDEPRKPKGSGKSGKGKSEKKADEGTGSEPTGYDALDHAALKAVIDGRNEGREADAKISKAGNKAVLIERLVADDA